MAECVKLAKWFCQTAINFEYSIPVIMAIMKLENHIKDKYKSILIEQSEIDKIIRIIWPDLVEQQILKAKEDEQKNDKNEWNQLMYEQFNYRNLNKTQIIPIKKSDPDVTRLFE